MGILSWISPQSWADWWRSTPICPVAQTDEGVRSEEEKIMQIRSNMVEFGIPGDPKNNHIPSVLTIVVDSLNPEEIKTKVTTSLTSQSDQEIAEKICKIIDYYIAIDAREPDFSVCLRKIDYLTFIKKNMPYVVIRIDKAKKEREAASPSPFSSSSSSPSSSTIHRTYGIRINLDDVTYF